jgi:hypothetical protein
MKPRLIFTFALLFVFSTFAETNSSAPDVIPPLAAPRGEIPATFWEQHSIAVLFGGIVLLALISALIWFVTRPKPRELVPAEVQARHTLESLAQKPETGAVLSQVSQSLRRYISAVFNFTPGELTTTEFCQAMAGHDRVGTQLAAPVTDFLRRCDELKFAPKPPAQPFGAAAQALHLVELAETRREELRVAELAAAANTPKGK